MDWTNTQEDASGIEDQIRMRQMIEQNPWLLNQILAASTGVANLVPGQNTQEQDRYVSNFRSQAPVAYRAGSYGAPAAVGAIGAMGGNPALVGVGAAGLAEAARQDPVFRNRLAGR